LLQFENLLSKPCLGGSTNCPSDDVQVFCRDCR